jgi:hypothetical protein
VHKLTSLSLLFPMLAGRDGCRTLTVDSSSNKAQMRNQVKETARGSACKMPARSIPVDCHAEKVKNRTTTLLCRG